MIMLINDIIEQIDEGGPKSYYSFETFILNLLKHHLEMQKKELITKLPRDQVGDAIAPSGFDEFEGPVIFDIKFNLAKISIRWLTDTLTAPFSDELRPSSQTKTFIIISAKAVPILTRKRFIETVARLSISVNLVIWGPEEINAIVELHSDKANEIAKNLFALRLETAANKPVRDWKTDREEIIGKITDHYRNGQFSLFLGAGVSSSAGMPDWNKLLNSLFVTYLAQELDPNDDIDDAAISELVARLNSVDEPSSLMAARYLRKGLTQPGSDTKGFIKAVTKSLYGLRNRELCLGSPLVRSIANLCMPRRTGAKVRCVVTYNFDDLLERQLSEKSIFYKCVYTQNETYDLDELPVYHVHGFIPESDGEYDHLDASTLVFSEEGYHQIYSDAYHWSNLVQLNSLRENNCLMIGLSMTDPNLRRLLDIAARNIERSKHFAFMKRLTEDRFCFEKSKISGENVAVVRNLISAREFLERHHLLNEELMKELGVTVIWYENYEDIPAILKRIAEGS
jgi:hypothetical protein